ncbi:putative glycolipid-binding domain-containing protein [Isoptericola sp. G70]
MVEQSSARASPSRPVGSTNTLPIRRLGLAVGEFADIVTVYVDHESFTVTTDPQR